MGETQGRSTHIDKETIRKGGMHNSTIRTSTRHIEQLHSLIEVVIEVMIGLHIMIVGMIHNPIIIIIWIIPLTLTAKGMRGRSIMG